MFTHRLGALLLMKNRIVISSFQVRKFIVILGTKLSSF